MAALPPFMALPLTLMTGRPQQGQKPVGFSPTLHLVNALCSLTAGVAVATAGWAGGSWWLMLLLPGWAMTLHGMRNLRMMIFHQCAHRNMWGKRGPDQVLGRALAALLLIQHFDSYSAEHVREHHAVHHMTLRDPTVQAVLVMLRLRPGMSRGQMWRRTLAKLVSPWFHLSFLYARVRAYLHGASRRERLAFCAGLTALGLAATWFDVWPWLLVVWLLPLTLFFQISNTLRLCVKHTFPPAGTSVRSGHAYFASLTNAIFLGEAMPAAHPAAPHRWWRLLRWSLRMAFVHFPARYLVLTGDTVCHDFHHRRPMSRNWADYIFAREREVEARRPDMPAYRHVWGLVPAVNAVFDSLGAADPAEYDPRRLTEVNRREIFMAFDD